MKTVLAITLLILSATAFAHPTHDLVICGVPVKGKDISIATENAEISAWGVKGVQALLAADNAQVKKCFTKYGSAAVVGTLPNGETRAVLF